MIFKEMIATYFKRNWWYLTLVMSSSIYVFYYKNDIFQTKEINTINLIFILWIVLLFLPLFSEMEFFGIKLKKEIEKAKYEVKENINDLRIQIMDLKISNSNANTINLGNGFLPTEQKLKEMIEKFITNSNTAADNSKSKTDKSTDKKVQNNIDFEIPEESTYLFKVRLTLEKIMTDLCEKTDYNGRKSMIEMTRHLNKNQIINRKTVEMITEIIKITNRGVHGEIISKEYIDFVKQVFPEIQKQLYESNNQFNYNVCPKCKSSGYSRFENYCPKCGFTSDD